jgi:hypothetical protein
MNGILMCFVVYPIALIVASLIIGAILNRAIERRLEVEECKARDELFERILIASLQSGRGIGGRR